MGTVLARKCRNLSLYVQVKLDAVAHICNAHTYGEMRGRQEESSKLPSQLADALMDKRACLKQNKRQGLIPAVVL